MRSVDGLYVHIPFCKKRCKYCDFYSSESLDCAKAYIASLLSDLKTYKTLISKVKTIYIGGGTPSVIGETIAPLLESLSSVKPLEFSIEVNPESLTSHLLSLYKTCGVNRISMGVQSLQEEELSALGRLASPDTVRKSLNLLATGTIAFSVDLMAGIPYQTKETLLKTLKEVLAYAPNHISVYPLQLEEGTVLYEEVRDGVVTLPSEDSAAELWMLANSCLKDAGYEHYEVANYARDQAYAKHNVGYWNQASYLGLGTSAASQLLSEHYAYIRSVRAGLPELKAETVLVRVQDDHLDELNVRVAKAEKLMLAARLKRGISFELVDESIEVFGKEAVQNVLKDLVDTGFLSCTNSGYVPTSKGWLFGNELYLRFLELA